MTPEELNKIIKETEILELDINDRKRKKRKSLADRIATLSGWLTAIITMVVSGFGLFNSLVNYVDKKAEQTEFALNQSMISLVKEDITNSKAKSRTITLLSYYEYNSLPILLYFLESESDRDVRLAISESIVKILLNSHDKSRIIKEVRTSFILFLHKVQDKNDFYPFQTYLSLFQNPTFKQFEDRDAKKELSDTLLVFKQKKFQSDTARFIWFVDALSVQAIGKLK